MLQATHLMGFAAGGASAAVLTFLQSETPIVATQSSYTFSNVDIRAAAADRYVIVCITGDASINGRTLTGVTIGGNAAAPHANEASNVVASTTSLAAIFGLLVPSGTTATVVANFSNTMAICYCHTYLLASYQSATPTATKTKGTDPGTGTSLSDTIDIAADGALLVTASSATSTGHYAMTGVLEDADINTGNVPSCAGHQANLPAETARAYSVTISANTPNMAMAAAAWH